jgi:hypothetical protein
MDTLHFDGRDVPPYAVYAAEDALIVGGTYFMLHYVDHRCAVPVHSSKAELHAFQYLAARHCSISTISGP